MKPINKEFWHGKRVFITGHTGFKGSWLATWLRRMGADVTGYSLPPPTAPSMYAEARVGDGIRSIEGDVRDLPNLEACMSRYSPEIVIHLAAQAMVKTGYSDPLTTYTSNVVGTLHMLESVRKVPSVRVVVTITSDKCYDNQEWIWGYRENDRMGGHDPYSSSKGCAELLISAYRDSYFPPARIADHGVALASTRAGNVIGGGDWSADRLVPDVMRAIMKREPVQIRRPAAIRPWQFVLEPLRGYLDLAERLWHQGEEFAEGWNFGPDPEQIQPVQWIVEHLAEKWGEGASWSLDQAIHPHEDHFLRLDCTKAKTLLGWRPALALETALDWIVEWYRASTTGDDVRELTEEQIARYEKLFETGMRM
jgi:CDP-glucose 4,6-dehydratase